MSTSSMDSAPTPVRQSNLVSSADLPPPPSSPRHLRFPHPTPTPSPEKGRGKCNTLLASSRALIHRDVRRRLFIEGKAQKDEDAFCDRDERRDDITGYGSELLNAHFRSDMIRLTRDNGQTCRSRCDSSNG